MFTTNLIILGLRYPILLEAIVVFLIIILPIARRRWRFAAFGIGFMTPFILLSVIPATIFGVLHIYPEGLDGLLSTLASATILGALLGTLGYIIANNMIRLRGN